MGKRQAEYQLTDRDPDGREGSEEPESGDFKQASQEQLSTRKIRGLPKSRSASPAVATSKSSSHTNGFSFSSPSPAVSSPSAAAASKAPENKYISLRGLNHSVITSLQALIAKDPFVDLSPSLSILISKYAMERRKIDAPSTSTSIAAASSSPAPSTPSFAFGAATSSSTPAPSFAFKPPASSESASVSSAPKSPFAGFSFGQPASTSTPKPTSEAAPAEDKPKKSGGPPAPPSGGFSFGGKIVGNASSAPSASSTPTTGGFVFTPPKDSGSSEKSPFSFGPAPKVAGPAPAPTSSESPFASSTAPAIANAPTMAKQLSTGLSSAPAKPSPLRMASHVESPPSASKSSTPGAAEPVDKPKFNPFAAVTLMGSSADKKTEDKPASSTSASPFSFGNPTITFGSATSTSAPKTGASTFSFGSTPVSTSSNSSDPKPAFSFGFTPSASTSASTSSGAPAFSFSTTNSTMPSSSLGFGASTNASAASAKASTGVGFSFGSSTTPSFSFTPSSTPVTSEAGSAPEFSFGSSDPPKFSFTPASGTSAAASTNVSTAASSRAGSEAPGENEDATSQEPPEPPKVLEGEGEEDDDVLYDTKSSVYVMDDRTNEKGETSKQWVNRGVSQLRLNQNKETGKIRLLARNAANGRVILNFFIYKTIKPDVVEKEKAVAFTAMFGEVPKMVKARVKDLEKAKALADAIRDAASKS